MPGADVPPAVVAPALSRLDVRTTWASVDLQECVVARSPEPIPYTEESSIVAVDVSELAPPISHAELLAWGRSMSGGDTSHMLDI